MDILSSSFLSTLTQTNVISHSPSTASLQPSSRASLQILTTTSKRSNPGRPRNHTPLVSSKNHVKRLVDEHESLPIRIFSAFSNIVKTFVNPPLRVSVDPTHVLSDNFFPVDELPPTECVDIEGTLPSCLDGVYFRNGPNPQFLPSGPYHLFDGDGMLHAIRISRGKATMCSRFVKTYRYKIEKDAGFPIIPYIFSGFNGVIVSVARMTGTIYKLLMSQFDPSNGIGSANTSLSFFGNKLYALVEFDLPYAIKLEPNGDITTLGRHDFDGKLSMNMTAHPKIDPTTKEAFAFRYNLMYPFLSFFWFDKKGDKQVDVPIFSLTNASFVHDFAITKNYAIFPDTQVKMSLIEMIRRGSPMRVDHEKVPRLGVIPRYAKDESDMKWFNVPGFNSVHIINAWEEDDGNTLVMVAPNILPVDHLLERMDLIHASIEKVRINLKTGMVSRHLISTRNLDFAVINPAFVSIKNRYVYSAIGDPFPKVSGVVKLDISLSEVGQQECIVARRMFGPGCFGGEPFFVAKEPDNPNVDEDDGYIVSYVHNENTNESKFLVMDAKSPTLEIVISVKLPCRVPYGFHGLFVKESDINKL